MRRSLGRAMGLAALGLLVAAGCSRPKAAGLDFAAYGDCRSKKSVHRSICEALSRSGAAFTLVTGDLVDAPEDESAWAEYRQIAAEIRKKPYFCAVGDHDGGPKDFFLKEMSQDRFYYDRRVGDYHIFVLDSRNRFRDPEQLRWLEKTASASTARHKFAVFHHPPFMIDRNRGAEADLIRPNIHPVLVRLKFCAVFCGHQHAFYSTVRDGLRYVVTAGGGAPLWKIAPELGQPGDLSRKCYHFVGFKVEGPSIRGQVYDDGGGEIPDLAFTLCTHPAGH